MAAVVALAMWSPIRSGPVHLNATGAHPVIALASYTQRTTVTRNTSGTTLTITTHDVGDVVVVYAMTTTLTGAVEVTSVTDSDSRVTWQPAPVVAHTDATHTLRQEIWYGRVTSVGSTEIAVHWVGTPGGG